MKIGVSVNHERLNQFDFDYGQACIKIRHIQINGLPAEVSLLKEGLRDKIDNFKMTHPEIEISFHAYTKINFAESVKSIRKVWLEHAKELIDFAAETNAEFVVFHCGYGIDAGSRFKKLEYLEIAISAIQELLLFTQQRGIEIHIENLYSESTRSDFCKVGDRLSQFQRVFNHLNDRLLKICYDYGHGNLDENGIDILHNLSHKIGSIHVHDNDQIVDIHAQIGCPLVGTIDWEKELTYLKKINYTGPFILEGYVDDQKKSLKYLRENFGFK